MIHSVASMVNGSVRNARAKVQLFLSSMPGGGLVLKLQPSIIPKTTTNVLQQEIIRG